MGRPYEGAFQSTILGQFIRLISRNKLLKFSDETDFPEDYTRESIARKVERQGRARTHGSDPRDTEKAAQANKEAQFNVDPPIRPPPVDRSQSDAGSLHFYVNGHDLGLGRPISPIEGIGVHPSLSAATLTNPPAPSVSRSFSGSGSGDGGGSGSGHGDGSDYQSPKTAGEKAGKPQNGEDRRKESPANAEEAEKGDDPNLVGWYGHDDPENPLASQSFERRGADQRCVFHPPSFPASPFFLHSTRHRRCFTFSSSFIYSLNLLCLIYLLIFLSPMFASVDPTLDASFPFSVQLQLVDSLQVLRRPSDVRPHLRGLHRLLDLLCRDHRRESGLGDDAFRCLRHDRTRRSHRLRPWLRVRSSGKSDPWTRVWDGANLPIGVVAFDRVSQCR